MKSQMFTDRGPRPTSESGKKADRSQHWLNSPHGLLSTTDRRVQEDEGLGTSPGVEAGEPLADHGPGTSELTPPNVGPSGRG